SFLLSLFVFQKMLPYNHKQLRKIHKKEEKMVDKKENEEYFLQIKPSSNVSDLIFQLCQAFEKIYALLSVENN
ncbi:MAG: hypothetical protein KHZ15_11385, partial [Coprobacillus cateniformis]|nr:hypothetical protein [Coprobacillus cateniformis]